MPKYRAQCGFSIEFRLAATISKIESVQDTNSKWVDDYTKGRDEEYKKLYLDWLTRFLFGGCTGFNFLTDDRSELLSGICPGLQHWLMGDQISVCLARIP